MQQTLVFGDIHGCFYELQSLLDKSGLGDGDAIIAIGDMVDRGPETPQVVEFFQKTPGASAIMGNHERKHVRAARHEVKLSISQQISQIQLSQKYLDALEWMAGLPLFIELPEAILVHGYLEPGIDLEHQNPSVLCGTIGGEKILHEHYDRPWYELYESSKPVIVGHYNYTNSSQPFIHQQNVIGLDTDCVTGKALTGILLPSFQFVSVPSRGNLWAQVRQSYLSAQRKKPTTRLPPTKPVWNEGHNGELRELYQKLSEANDWMMQQTRNIPGFSELPPRQQSRLYADRIGRGVVQDLLQLMRQGKLEIELLRKIVHDPYQVGPIIAQIDEVVDHFSQQSFQGNELA
jgi:hypothetical protein